MPKVLYSELDLAKDSIRLLRIKNGYLFDDIDCELIVTLPGASEWPTYSALSYSWVHRQDAEDTSRGTSRLPHLWVNDQRIEITEDLCAVLQHIRRPKEDVFLWVDAICIDQANSKEKGHQVRQMADIYRNAEEVCIWLGPSSSDATDNNEAVAVGTKDSTDDGEAIAELMLSISWIDRQATQAQALGHSASWGDLCRGFFLQRLGDPGSQAYVRQANALAGLLGRRWFTRVWVLQEVAMARRARIMCGPHSCPARTFALMPSFMELGVGENTQAVLDIMPRFRNKTWWSSSRQLHELLAKFAGSEATDERDKVYALLGLSEDACDSARFYPSYEKSPTQVFRDAASFVLCRKVLDAEGFFLPEFTFQDLCLPLVPMAQKVLFEILVRKIELGPARNTATLLADRFAEGQLDAVGLLRLLAEKYGALDRAERLLSAGNARVSLDWGGRRALLRIRSTTEGAGSFTWIFPGIETAALFPRLEWPSHRTGETVGMENHPLFFFAEDEGKTEAICHLIRVEIPDRNLLRACIWAGDGDYAPQEVDDIPGIIASDIIARANRQSPASRSPATKVGGVSLMKRVFSVLFRRG